MISTPIIALNFILLVSFLLITIINQDELYIVGQVSCIGVVIFSITLIISLVINLFSI